ncbi:hypothetical protein COOONC_28697 [Cooperia oncophora]
MREPYTVEELTARQFRTVFDYITTNNVLRDQIRNTHDPGQRNHACPPVVHITKTLLEIVEYTTESFHNLAVLLELLIPRLFKWDDDTDFFRATLQLVGLTEQKVMEILQHCSAVTAHATRMIRVMEAHQMVHIMNRKTVRVTAEDEQYRFQFPASIGYSRNALAGPPPTAPEQPSQRPATTITIPKAVPQATHLPLARGCWTTVQDSSESTRITLGSNEAEACLAIMPQEVAATNQRSPAVVQPVVP